MDKKLTRSTSDKIIGGVCGGVARYLGVDAGLVRLITAAIILLTGFGPFLYLAAWFLLPDDNGRSGLDWLMGQIRSGTGNGNTGTGNTGTYREDDLR